jgi:hypothetical protein
MKMMRTLGITILVLLQIPYSLSAQTKEYWMWVLDRKAPLTSAFCNSQQVIVVGQLINVQTAEGVKVYNDNILRISGAKIYTIRIDEVLKGPRVSPSEDIHVLILPWVEVYGNLPPGVAYRQIFEQYQQTGKLPSDLPRQTENYPEIPLKQQRIFFLFPADFNDPTGNMLWVGMKELSAGRQFYGYTDSFQISKSRKEVGVVKRYLEISNVKNQDEQIRQLAQYSLDLLRGRESPKSVALGAVHNLRGFHSNWAWGRVTQRLGNGQIIVGPASRLTAVYLSDPEMNELMQITTDSSWSADVRSWLVMLFAELNEHANRAISPGPFLRLLQDRTEDHYVRWNAIYLLEQLDGPEVRTVFREMLLEEPRTDSERTIWNRLKDSPILKAPQ